MTTPIAEFAEQEHGVLEAPHAGRCGGAGMGFEPADAELELDCVNGRFAACLSLPLDVPSGEVP